MKEPLFIDLCYGVVYGAIHGNRFRQGEMGEGVAFEKKTRIAADKTWRESQEARSNQITGAPILALDDDSLPVERTGATGLPSVSRQRDKGLPTVVGVLEFSLRYGTKTDSDPYVGQN